MAKTRGYNRLRYLHMTNEQREKRRDYNKKWMKKWRNNYPDRSKEIAIKMERRRRFGSVKRYNEAMLKYEGECAFACGRQAQSVHHIDGKSIHNSPKDQINNNLENLLPLCNSCHMWLHHLKIKGRKNATARTVGY